ncbi:Crp/Fnr family transcriptional regulator [Hymenobacter terrenus]|uniref:Crp/Fnr family transcriptional regulator n=1 Tax=Hymenobacter terrenus TaxID=1629124 RepID=UPI000619F786|nr:Crp/Fnr family transcriptional regulator [Hymenobacter terrenus]
MEELLHQIGLVSPLPDATVEALRPLFSPLALAKNEFLVQAGEGTRTVAFVTSGVLRAFFTSPDGVEYNKTFFETGDFLGVYYALLLERPSHLSMQALVPTQLWVADFAQLTALYDQHPALERFARRQAERLFLVKEQREIDLVMLDAKVRYEQFRQQHPDLEQQIPQYHIASHLGITPTQLSRIRAGER